MSTPNLSPELRVFHQHWNGGEPITDVEEKHRFTEAFARHVARIDPRWGRKSRAGGAPISKDTIAYWTGATIPASATDGLVDARDIIRSNGVVQWLGPGSPDYDNITARWFPVVAAPEPEPEPPPAPAPPEYDLESLVVNVERMADGVETVVRLLTSISAVLEDVQKNGVRVRWV